MRLSILLHQVSLNSPQNRTYKLSKYPAQANYVHLRASALAVGYLLRGDFLVAVKMEEEVVFVRVWAAVLAGLDVMFVEGFVIE